MSIKEDIKKLIIESLALEEITPEDIKDDEPLFNEGLGLDSIDALELGMAIKRKYNISMEEDKDVNKKYFYFILHNLYKIHMIYFFLFILSLFFTCLLCKNTL